MDLLCWKCAPTLKTQKWKSHSCFDRTSPPSSLRRSSCLGDAVRCHAGVVLAVAPGGPDEEGGGHHLQRDGDEGEVEGPAQSDLHPLGPREGLVEQIQAGQETADCPQRAQTWGGWGRGGRHIVSLLAKQLKRRCWEAKPKQKMDELHLELSFS